MPRLPQLEGPQNVAQYLDLPTRRHPALNVLLRLIGGETPGPVFGGEPVAWDPAQEAMGLGGPLGIGKIVNSPTNPVPPAMLGEAIRQFPTAFRRLLTSKKTPSYTTQVGKPSKTGIFERALADVAHTPSTPITSHADFFQNQLGLVPTQQGSLTLAPRTLDEPNPFQHLTHELMHVLQGTAPEEPLRSAVKLSREALNKAPQDTLTDLLLRGYNREELSAELPAFAAQHMARRYGDIASPVPAETGTAYFKQLRTLSKQVERQRKQRAFEKVQGIGLTED